MRAADFIPLIAVLAYVACVACANHGPAIATAVCVPVKAYTPAEEQALAAAIAALPADSPLGGAMVDYGHMRAAARVCAAAAK